MDLKKANRKLEELYGGKVRAREEDGCRGRSGRKQVAKSGIHSMMMDNDRKMPKKPEAATGSCGIFSPA